MHTYKRATGEWWNKDKNLLGIGYAGYDDGDGVPEPGEGKNDPSKSNVKNVGPLPAGRYWISLPFNSPVTGAFSLRLIPQPGNEMFGRGGFVVHGEGPVKGASSHGCPVLALPIRRLIAESGDCEVEVV